jgi:AraC family transcriptional regulator, alkane utilization regulator
VSKQVATFPDADVPGQLVWDFRIHSSVLCRSVMAPPWGFSVPERQEGSFHLLLAGEGWLEVDGVKESVRLTPGDLVVLPRGNGHRVKDSHRSAAPPLVSILASHAVVDGELHFGGSFGPRTEVVCGVFSSEGGRPPWFEQLGPLILSRGSSDGTEWRAALVVALRDEARAPTAGGAALVNRWLESILGDALRAELSKGADGVPAGSVAVGDERIGRVLARIHDQPESRWTLARLATVATMSRSGFAARFRALVGQPPASYVTRIRLDRADRLLRTGDATLADIARRVGYGSEESLSRAFKARFGVAPSMVRPRGRPASRGA